MAHEIQIDEAVLTISMDYFCKKILSGTSSGKVILQYLNPDGTIAETQNIYSHKAPIYGIDWAHPSFGDMFVSGDSQGILRGWTKLPNQTDYSLSFEQTLNSPITSLKFCPNEYGCSFAISQSSGQVTVYTKKDPNSNFLAEQPYLAHNGGCTSVSWCPAIPPTSLLAPGIDSYNPKRLATGGCDKCVCVWRHNGHLWECEHRLEHHTHWVRDVEWAPSFGMPGLRLASSSEDKSIVISTALFANLKQWQTQKIMFEEIPWSVKWSETGTILAVSLSTDKVHLLQEGVDGSWSLLKEIDREME
ncbi:putative Protein SEC13 like protein [Blattamonas nauphoetae]|uniref:Uncharacterized protein n=1 Tax=Blattamonas nauphoetae TaxID=2049346 RepID=A0ABQ9YFP0_9EUKA|nr:putative Protein SEC13 like protein [Blattamonas nauphoetae]